MEKLTIVMILDHEYEGRCDECKREGLRWVARMSDGSGVGLECAKKILGYRPSPDRFKWTEFFTPVFEYRESETSIWVLWEHKKHGRSRTRSTKNGYMMADGGARKDFQDWGWLPKDA